VDTRRAGNPVSQLGALDQLVWLDYLDRPLLQSGRLRELIRQYGVSGVTTNPAIFGKAFTDPQAYRAQLVEAGRLGLDATGVYEALVNADVAAAAQELLPVYRASGRSSGYVSVEVSPHLAHDTRKTIAAARSLWRAIDRPNLMIKVPATRAGLPAIRQLISDGINVNATLLFSVQRYRAVLDAYMAGLEDRFAPGLRMLPPVSVASFFVSRLDAYIDPRLPSGAEALRGEGAIAVAQTAYAEFRATLASARWKRLAADGAPVQRLLWASTSAKDPAYSAIKYVEALVAEQTITTLPPDTLVAYAQEGHPRLSMARDSQPALDILATLARVGLEAEQVADALEEEGIRKFIEPFDHSIAELRALLCEPA
jgi:transaldolase